MFGNLFWILFFSSSIASSSKDFFAAVFNGDSVSSGIDGVGDDNGDRKEEGEKRDKGEEDEVFDDENEKDNNSDDDRNKNDGDAEKSLVVRPKRRVSKLAMLALCSFYFSPERELSAFIVFLK